MLRALFLASLAAIALSCGFQKLEHPALQFIDSTAPNEQNGRLLQQGYQNMRIHADYSYLESIDSKQRDYIQNEIMPSAITYYETALKVIPMPQTLKISSVCAGYDPPAYFSNPGVDADLVILVTAEYLPDVDFVAGAVPCGLSLTDNRPMYGMMLFNLAYLPMDKVTDDQENLSTALHELVHILGFNSDFYSYYINPETGQTLTGVVGRKIVNGKLVMYLNVEPLTSRLRTYFACDTLEGAYLEDEGDAGSAGSHFERRVFMNEYMTASSITEPVISNFTLALLEGTGWYQPNYNMTEPFNWGRGEGCTFLDGSCVNDQGAPSFSEFCDATVQKGCSFTSRGIGFCGTGQFTDFFANGCPYYLSSPSFDCEDPSNQATAFIDGETYGPSSRCFTGTLVESVYQATYGAYCFPTQCNLTRGNYTLTLTIDSMSIQCASAGPISVDGYNGQLNCPDPNEFCTRANPKFCEKGCSGRGRCVSNVCVCPAGWGGVDCAQRVFDETCTRCVNETGGCYGDQCRTRDEVVFEEEPTSGTTVNIGGSSAKRIIAAITPLIVFFALL